MSAPNLPNTLLKLGLALAKHHIKNVIGDEALEIAASTLTDVGGEKVQAKVDSIFASKEGQKELLKAAKAADERFKEKCKDNDLRQLFTMDYGDFSSVQKAIASLPEALDDDALRETLFTAFRNDSPKSISDEQINEGVSLYVECLQSALLPVEDFGQRIIHNALKEIGKDVKDIKADVKSLLEKTSANSQDATALQKSYARFLVPFPHNPDFVGRDSELSSLHEMLQQGQSIVGIRPTVLVGLGGIGKTQLAVEYAHAYRADYPSGVFWLNAINPLLFEFSDLAEKLEMSDRDTPRDKAARKAWDYLDSHPDALVIFDNVLEPSELNVPFSPDLVPANLRCRTLFTTRQRDFPRTFQPFEVKVLPEMAAMKLLLRSRPAVLEEHHPEWGWARIVCAYLGWLPLALELAAAYLGAYPDVSIMGYLERLRTEGSLATVDESEVRAADLPTRVEEILKAAAAGNLELKHQVAVSATLQTQWQRLGDNDARLLFRAAGQFPEASWIPVPRLGLLTGIESEAKAGRPSPLNVVLKKLHAVSLIEELSDDRLRLHPLVQEFAVSLSQPPEPFHMEMAERVAAEFKDLLRLQARVILYGVDVVIEDLRTALGFCIEQKETETYSRISKMERVLDSLAYMLRDWNAHEQPDFFFQQIRNDAFARDLEKWQVQAEVELARLKKPYLLERFPMRSDPAELRTLIGCSPVALSADGRLAVSGALDHTLKVWDVGTGRELRTLTGHSKGITRVALSADGQVAVSGSHDDDTLKVWDVATGRELRTLIGHSKGVTSVALSADGWLAVSASLDDTLKVWDVATGRELRTFAVDFFVGAEKVALSTDGRLAVSTTYDSFIVWDVETGRKLHTLIEHSIERDKKHVETVALSADGRIAVSALEGKVLQVWDVETGRELRKFRGRHSDRVYGIALSADGRLAVFTSDQTLKVWDITTGRELRTLRGHSGWVNAIAMSADGRLVVSVGDQTLKVWDISAALALSEVEGFNASAEIGGGRSKIIGNDSLMNVALSADGRMAVSALDDKILKVWDVETGRELHALTGHNSAVTGVALSADGRLAVSASYDKTLKVWDVEAGRELYTLTGYSPSGGRVALSADGRRLVVSATTDGLLEVWDVTTERELRTLDSKRRERAWCVALSADGRLAVSADTWHLKVFNVRTGRELRTLRGHKNNVYGVALSADGRLAVSASLDETFKVWDVTTGSELYALRNSPLGSIAISADGRLAVSASNDLIVWNVATGHCTATLLVSVSLAGCAISVDGKTIAVGDVLGRVHFLELVGADEIQAPENWIDISIAENKKVQAREKVARLSSQLPRWLKGLLERQD
jgi:WD40 repeat protein